MKNPLIPMCALTGKPSENDIYNYLHGLKSVGIDQVMIYPRSGCLLEYLSEEWFLAIEGFLKSAQLLDMSVWLYDDFNWPSGDAKGAVTSFERFRLKSIKTLGEDIGKTSCKSTHNSGLFGEKFFPNLMNDEAVDYFISITHEEYHKRFKNYFGAVIKGIFTDEPAIGYCLEDNSLPYYDGIENDYQIKYKRCFENDLFSFYEEFSSNVMALVSDKFKSCYIDKIASWCSSHGILMTGHLMCDNEPFWAVKYGGDFLKNLSSFSLPGIDEISTCFEDRTEMALLGGIEYCANENGAMSELFALGPIDMAYAKKKCMIYLAACHKIDHYFLAISHIDISGNYYVRDYFNDFAVAQPDFNGIRLLGEEAKRATAYAKKDYKADVYIKFPTDISLKCADKGLDFSNLFSLINDFSYSGIQWKYITNEKVNDAPIIEINESIEFFIDKKVVKPSEIIALFDKKAIKDKNGLPVKGIFRRRFNDGSFIILNLFAKEGNYIIDGKEIYLEKHAVVTEFKASSSKKEKLEATFEVNYGNPNITRLMYLNDNETAYIDTDCDFDVQFAIRNDVCAKINGKTPVFTTDTLLPIGIKEHYKITEVEKIVEKATIMSCNDLKYLPSVLVIGDFCCASFDDASTIKLTKRKKQYNTGEEIYDFGKVSFLTKVTVPNLAKGIEIKGTKLYTLLYVNDELVEEKIAAPYIFKIDNSQMGKELNLKIVQYSSLAPIFGNVDYWDKNVKFCGWRGTPSTKKTVFGFTEISWIY